MFGNFWLYTWIQNLIFWLLCCWFEQDSDAQPTFSIHQWGGLLSSEYKMISVKFHMLISWTEKDLHLNENFCKGIFHTSFPLDDPCVTEPETLKSTRSLSTLGAAYIGIYRLLDQIHILKIWPIFYLTSWWTTKKFQKPIPLFSSAFCHPQRWMNQHTNRSLKAFLSKEIISTAAVQDTQWHWGGDKHSTA